MSPTLHFVPHTHWDREWYEPFSAMRYRLVKVVDDLLAVLDDPAFPHFMFDGQTAAIEDYLDIRPGAEPDVINAVGSGRLAIGPWRIIPDEFLCSPETLIRNLQQGAASAARLGGRMDVGYLPDPFGHIGQMPQLLRGVGLDDAALWRGVPAAIDRTAFRWEAPDGSSVRTAYMPFGYGHAAGLSGDVEDGLRRAARIIADLAPFQPGEILLAPAGNDHASAPPHLPDLADAVNEAQDEIRFVIGSLRDYVDSLPPADELPLWTGEMRSGARANLLMGVISARLPLKRAEFAATSTLERITEPLAALTGLPPGGLLERAWRGVVENSAHDSVTGCGVDEVARDVAVRYEEAQRVADLIAADALTELAARADASHLSASDEGVFVFNPSPRARAGVAEVTLTAEGPPDTICFEDLAGVRSRAQVVSIREQVALDMTPRGSQLLSLIPMVTTRKLAELYVNDMEVLPGRQTTIKLSMGMAPSGSFDVEDAKRRVEELAAASPRARFRVIGTGPPLVTFLVETPPVPGLGWSSLRPVVGDTPRGGASAGSTWLDNGLIRAEVAPDGTVSLIGPGGRWDGLLGIEDGGDAGDEYNYSPPPKDVVVNEPGADAVVTARRAGPVEAALRIERRYRVPVSLTPDAAGRTRKTAWMPVTVDLALRAGERFVRARVTLDNVARDHRTRAIFPLPFTTDTSAADGAFEVVERGIEAEGGPHEAGLPTFPSRRWVSASDGERGLAIAHLGTPEYELVGGSALAVTLVRAVGYLSRHGMSARAAPAGPVVETPGAQVPGVHVIDLAIYPHEGNWSSGNVHDVAEAFCYPLRAAGIRAHEGSLPGTGGSLWLQPDPVQLSALHPDDEGVQCRIVNASNEAVEARISIGAPLPTDRAERIDLLGSTQGAVPIVDGAAVLPLRPWEIATIRLR